MIRRLARSVLAVGTAAGLWMASPAAANANPPDGLDELDTYPVAAGRYSSPDIRDFYWVFFKTPDGRACGIAPNGGEVGCDAVPIDAPEGANQTVASSWAAAEYRHSDAPTFTRDVDVLPEGHRLENWGSTCAVGYQGAVTCRVPGGHGFVLASPYAVLW